MKIITNNNVFGFSVSINKGSGYAFGLGFNYDEYKVTKLKKELSIAFVFAKWAITFELSKQPQQEIATEA